MQHDEFSTQLSGCRLLTTDQAADALKVSKSWLDKARVRGDGPAFTRIGRGIRYRPAALQEYALAHERANTSQAA